MLCYAKPILLEVTRQLKIMKELSLSTNEHDGSAYRADTGDIMSLPATSEFLGIHRNTLYKLIDEGEIPAFRLTKGGRWKFRRRDIEDWLKDRQARSIR